MYRFYSDATVCYVYMADLRKECPNLEAEDDEESPLISSWKRRFELCKWFFRGWSKSRLNIVDLTVINSLTLDQHCKNSLLLRRRRSTGVNGTSLGESRSSRKRFQRLLALMPRYFCTRGACQRSAWRKECRGQLTVKLREQKIRPTAF